MKAVSSTRNFALCALLGFSSAQAWTPAASRAATQGSRRAWVPKPRGSTALAAQGADAVAGAASSLHASALAVAASMDVDSLPPAWIPAVVAVVIVAGTGALQLSLGDVMSEEADLGVSSGKRWHALSAATLAYPYLLLV